jgi:hypothetical protein
MKIRFLMIFTLVICSLLIIEVILAENGIVLPLIISTLYWINSEYIEPLYIAPYFEDLEIIDKYKSSFSIHRETYTEDDGEHTEDYDSKKKLHLSAYPHQKTFVDLIIDLKDDKFSYGLYCTEEFTTVSKDLELINKKLDQCIEKYS